MAKHGFLADNNGKGNSFEQNVKNNQNELKEKLTKTKRNVEKRGELNMASVLAINRKEIDGELLAENFDKYFNA